MNILSRRWAPEIILALADGPRRFNQLLNALQLGDRQVTIRLRELEAHGLVARHVEAGPPVRVTYDLTAAGLRYIVPLRALQAVQEVAGIAS